MMKVIIVFRLFKEFLRNHNSSENVRNLTASTLRLEVLWSICNITVHEANLDANFHVVKMMEYWKTRWTIYYALFRQQLFSSNLNLYTTESNCWQPRAPARFQEWEGPCWAQERKISWGSGTVPPVGSMGKTLVQGVWGAKSPWSWN